MHKRFGSTQFPSPWRLPKRYLKVHPHTKRKEKNKKKEQINHARDEEKKRKRAKPNKDCKQKQWSKNIFPQAKTSFFFLITSYIKIEFTSKPVWKKIRPIHFVTIK